MKASAPQAKGVSSVSFSRDGLYSFHFRCIERHKRRVRLADAPKAAPARGALSLTRATWLMAGRFGRDESAVVAGAGRAPTGQGRVSFSSWHVAEMALSPWLVEEDFFELQDEAVPEA